MKDFHSFRVTWITLALAAGIPMELVQRVTGHRTVEVVLKHYFRPGREDFKKRILEAMPNLLAGSGEGEVIDVVASTPAQMPEDVLEEVVEILKGVTGKANQKRVERVLEVLGVM